MLKGDQIKPTIFAENNLKSDFTTDELYVFGKYFLIFRNRNINNKEKF